MPRPWTVVIMLALAVSALTVSGCLSGSDALQQGKYVAIDEHLQVDCSLINGTDRSLPHITLPVVFDYDGNTTSSNWDGRGSSWSINRDGYYPEINDSFKVLYGSSYYRDVAPRDTLTGLQVIGVYAFPFTGKSGFTIENVARDGTVFGSYNNTSIVLKPGEQWVSPASTDIRSNNGTFMDTAYAYTAMFNTTWTVKNLGVLDKSNLTKYRNSGSSIGFSMLF